MYDFDVYLPLDHRPFRPVTRTASLPTPPSPYHRKLERAVSDVPEIYVSLIGSDSLPQLHESSVINHHPPLPSGDICCDGYTETEPPQSPLSVTSISTNEDTRYNMLSRSLPSSTDNLNGVVIPRPKPSEVDESGRPSSWSEGATVHITVNVSPTKSSPEAVHHETSCIHDKGSFKSLTNSISKLSDVSQSPVAERMPINEMETEIDGDILMMRPLSGEASDDNEIPPLSEVEVMNKPKAAKSKIHRGINVHFIPLHCDIYLNHNMSLSCHMHSLSF